MSRSRSSWPPDVANALGPPAQGVRHVWRAARCSSGASTRCRRCPRSSTSSSRCRRASRRRPARRRRRAATSARTRCARRCAARGAGDPVLVHDAARPLRRRRSSSGRCLAALDADADAAIAAAPVTDTIKEAGADGQRRRGRWTARRLWAIQTPQVFRRDGARARAGPADDGARRAPPTTRRWSRRAGGTVRLVESAAREPQGHDARGPAARRAAAAPPRRREP